MPRVRLQRHAALRQKKLKQRRLNLQKTESQRNQLHRQKNTPKVLQKYDIGLRRRELSASDLPFRKRLLLLLQLRRINLMRFEAKAPGEARATQPMRIQKEESRQIKNIQLVLKRLLQRRLLSQTADRCGGTSQT